MKIKNVEISDLYNSNPQTIRIKILWALIHKSDSVNIIKVHIILAGYGWLGASIVGEKGNSALFLVIQHANLKPQKQYLPLLRLAVKRKNASPKDLALLEDRVALREGKKQNYGSQLGMDSKTHKYYSLPLIDPDNVDKRRAKMGLEPIADYLSQWQVEWNVSKYKVNLPSIEKMEKVGCK